MMGEGITYKLTGTREEHRTLLVVEGDKTFPLHSTMYPSRETTSLARELEPGAHDVLIVLGTGLAYHLAPMERHLQEYSLILCIDILTGLEEHIARDSITAFLSRSEKVRFILGKNPAELGEILNNLIDFSEIRGIRVVEHPASIRAFPEYYEGARSVIQAVINRKAGSGATVRAFGPLFMRNILRMLEVPGRLLPVSNLFGIARGIPAVIVTPGPSLEKSLPVIGNNSRRFLVIAVDSAMSVLRQCRICPDICVSIDPQPYIAEHFQGAEEPKALVVSLSSSPLVLSRMGPTPVFLSLNSHPLGQLLEEIFPGDIGSVDSGTGSVAGDALQLALAMGCSHLVLAGFDFSFSGYRIYSRGTAYQRRYALYFQDRLNPVERANFNYIMKSSRGLRHEGVFTRRAFMHYRDRLADFLAGTGDARPFRVHGSPVDLPGAVRADWNDFLGQCPSVLDKSFLVRAIEESTALDRVMDTGRLSSVLGKGEVFRRVMDSALGGEPDARREGNLVKLLQKLL